MIMRNLWLVVLPTLVLLVISETFARNPLSVNEREHNVLTLSDVKGKKIKHKVRAPVSEQSLSEDLQGERIFKANEGKEDDGGRFKRDAAELDEVKNAKKSYAKLKLAQTENDLKKWKNKDYGKYLDEQTTRKIDKRQANYHNNRKSANRLKRHVKTRYQLDNKTDYYALRKAVMERFYARQKEIEEKHAKKLSSIPKYILTRSLETKTDTNNVSSTSQVEAKTDETNSVNDLVTDSDLGTSSSVTTTTESFTEATTKIDRNNFLMEVQPIENTTEFLSDEDTNNISDNNDEEGDDNVIGTLKWGNCTGRLVYKHNLKLTVHDAVSTVANLTASFSGPFCITCVRAIPMNITKGNMLLDVAKNENDEPDTVKVSMKGFHNDELWYITKVWATTKKEDVCEEVN
ncbi:uncharacterized protein LOC105662596 [Megachile rotundata]|uniref:uncharacterized protein LOC105662596 n=1 Tax=Megachile rotundata TaxID=143995 RepID=UPI003FD44E53